MQTKSTMKKKDPIQLKPSTIKKLRANQDIINQLNNQFRIISQGDADLRETVAAYCDIPEGEKISFDLEKGLIHFTE